MLTDRQMDLLPAHLQWCRDEIEHQKHALKLYAKSLHPEHVERAQQTIAHLEAIVDAFQPAEFQTSVKT